MERAISFSHKLTWPQRGLRIGFGAALFLICLPAFDRSSPLILTQGRVLNSTIRPGDTLKVDWVQTWRKLCSGTSAREVVRSDRKIDHYDAVPLEPPEHRGIRPRGGGVVLSSIMPEGPAVYRSVVTFPVQFSTNCIVLWPMQFVTPEVPFMVH